MSRLPVNSGARLLLLPLLATLLGAALAAPAAAQRQGDDVAVIHDRCVAYAHAHPREGLERAKLWRDQGGGFAAEHCIAMAMFELKDFAGAAKHFEELATRMIGMPPMQRAQTLDQAGQSWLDAGEPAHAKADFDAALSILGEEPDLLIDRAEAYAGMKQYWDAIDDLNRVIELAPNRADAYVYRGSAYRSVESLDLALEDVEHGLSLAPDMVLGLLERGNIKRLKGDVAGARKDWLRVVELAPNTPAAKDARINLARINAKPEPDAKKSP